MALLPALLDMVDDIYSNLDNPEKTVGDIPLLFVPHGRRGGRECPRRKEHGHHGHKYPCQKHGDSSDDEKKEEGRHGRCGRKERGHHGHKHPWFKHSDSSDDEKKEEGRKHGRCGRKEKHGVEGGRCRFAELRRGHCPYRSSTSCSRFGGRGCPCKKTSTDDFKVTFDVQSFEVEDISVKVKGREIFVEGKHDNRQDGHGFVSRQFTRRFLVPEEYDIDTVASYLDSDGKMTIVATKPKPPADESAERIVPIERVASVQEEVGEAFKNMDLIDDDTNDSKKTE